MAWRQHLDFSPVPFVKENQTNSSQTRNNCELESEPQKSQLDGQDVRSFYEDLVGLVEDAGKVEAREDNRTCRKAKRKAADYHQEKHISSKAGTDTTASRILPSNQHTPSKPARTVPSPAVGISFNAFLVAAQNGEEAVLKRALEAGSISVDTPDEFGWTGLMCAVAGNHESVVRLLLTHGADPGLKDKRGMNSMDIARKRRRPALVGILENWLMYRGWGEQLAQNKSCDNKEWKVKVKVEQHFCSVCNAKFSTSEESHNASTLHLFNMRLAPKQTDYQIPESNVGYRMMLRSGWNKESGLGSKGQGQKFPVKTKLKRDRKGLGKGSDLKAKVTHFNPNDRKAVKHEHVSTSSARTERPVTMSKRVKSAKEKHDKKIEMKFRRDFYT